MSETIVDATQLNINAIKYSSPKANASGGKSINILNKQTNTGLRLSTPLMLTWGASDFTDPATGKGNGKFELSLQFPSEDYKTEDATLFLKNMMDLEKKIKDDALTYSKEWFGKVHRNSDVVDALYTPMLKYSKDRLTGEPDITKSPTLRVKIPIWEGVWKCEIYDEDGNKLFPSLDSSVLSPIDFIQKGTNVAVLMQCGGIWFANGKFGVTWKLLQAVVQKPRASLTGQCFIKLKAADKEKLKATPPPITDTIVDDENCSKPQSVIVYDSDCEEEDADDDDDVKEDTSQQPEPSQTVASQPALQTTSQAQEDTKKKKVVRKKV
jgi:hypothetical protein